MADGRAASTGSLIADVWDLAALTTTGVHTDTERDPAVLADGIDQRAHAFLDGLSQQSVAASHAWLVEGVTVTLPTLICHLLNETTVHDYDIARADARRWSIPAWHAALVIDGILVPVIAGLGPRSLVDQKAAAGLQATYEIHVRRWPTPPVRLRRW